MNMSILSHNLLATMQSNLIMLVLMTVMIIKPELVRTDLYNSRNCLLGRAI